MAECDATTEGNRGRNLSRREFARNAGSTALAGSIGLVKAAPLLGSPRKTSDSASLETPVAQFYRSLDLDQRNQLCFPARHPLRARVANNWAVVPQRIADLRPEQQALCRRIFRGLLSDDGHDRLIRQMRDDYGGFENYHVALFGEPGTTDRFEWVLAGRHNTFRANGHRHAAWSFDGPVFYGHGVALEPHPTSDRIGNVWWDQAERASRLLRSLDERQRAQALVTAGSPQGQGVGLAVAELDPARKRVIQQFVADLVRPFHGFDLESIQNCLGGANGADSLRLSFFQVSNPPVDRESWDAWRIEAPGFRWSYHGTPHVHASIQFANQDDRDG